MSNQLNEYGNIAVGDTVKRDSEKFTTEGVVVSIEKHGTWNECESEEIGKDYCLCEDCYQPESRRVWTEVAEQGNLNKVKKIKYNQLIKISKEFREHEDGKMKLF